MRRKGDDLLKGTYPELNLLSSTFRGTGNTGHKAKSLAENKAEAADSAGTARHPGFAPQRAELLNRA